MRKLVLLLIGVIFMCVQLFAQNRTITGKVTDENGNPIPNASVMIKGTKSGTVTDSEGRYSLTIPGNARTLVISSIDKAEMEVSIGSQSSLTSTLKASNASLDEVVVVAYGTQKKKDVVGSISTVTADQMRKQQVVSVTQGLQGLATGVLIINGSGQPGTNPTIRVRGVGSVNASAEPLIVVDGIPFAGNINTINPNDVETMNVLKDATATSLYGSRAANGVIMITTKRGRAGKDASINVYGSYGVSSRALPEYDYVSSEDYLKLAWEAQRNYAVDNNIANPGQYASTNLINGVNTYGLKYNPYNVANPIDENGNLVNGAQLLWNTDWADEATNSSILRQNAGLSISGGVDKFRYFLSTDYLNQDGAVRNSNYRRLSTRFNGDANLRSWFKAGLGMNVSSSKTNNPSQSGSAFSNAVQFARIVSSIYPVYRRNNAGELVLDAAGNPIFDFGGPATGQTVNHNRPAASNMNAIALQTLDKSLSEGLQASMNAYGEITFTDWLKFKTTIGVDRYVNSSLTYANPLLGDAAPAGGRVRRDRNLTSSWTWNNMLSFDKSFGEHNFNALVSAEAFDFKSETLGAGTTSFPLPGIYEVGSGATKETTTSGTSNRRIESYFGRISYNYGNKYYLEGSLRRDGSTRFAPELRWGTFYAIGGSWVISNENFLSRQSLFNTIKLRASYGEVGNEGLTSFFPYLNLFNTGFNDLTNPGVFLGALGNPNVNWEKLGTYSIGLDLAFLNDRVSTTIEYYNKNTFDLLFGKPLPPSSGVTSIDDNIGKISNSGFELTINSRNIVGKNFNWSTNFNLATLRNRITALPQESIIDGTKRLEVGQSLNEFYIFEWAGVNPDNGKPQWYATDPADATKTIIVNQISSTATTPAARRSYQGSSLPKVTGGMSNDFTFKAFDLSFLLNYAFGGKILDSDWIAMMHGFTSVGGTLHTDILNRWQNPGDITDVPRLKFGNSDYGSASTRHLFSGDYVRLRNVTIGYTLPKAISNKTNDVIKSFRFYLQGDNLATWSNLKKGADPEQGIGGTTAQSSSVFRTISIGVNVGL